MMRLTRWLFVILLHMAAVFAWIVFFEHGPGWSRFQKGAEVEVERTWKAVRGWFGAA